VGTFDVTQSLCETTASPRKSTLPNRLGEQSRLLLVMFERGAKRVLPRLSAPAPPSNFRWRIPSR